MPGEYAQRLRQMVKNTEHRAVLEFWANDIDLNLGGDTLTMMYLNGRLGSFTACHNVANTLVEKAGTGAMTTLVNTNGDDFAPAVAAVRNGGCVMEVKFHDDHSVCILSRAGDGNVEILEAWAGAGVEHNSVDPYPFINSVFDHHDNCRPARNVAANALAQAAAGNNLAQAVGTLTRCVAGGCGIHHAPFKVTVKYRALDNINTFAMNTQTAVTTYTQQLSSLTYRELMGPANTNGTGVRCRVCFKAKPSWRLIQGYWHHCESLGCRQVYCDGCGATTRPRPPRHGYFGSDWTRHRQCTANDVMTMF